MESSAASRLSTVCNHLAIQPCFQQHAIHNDKPTGPADLARERAGASFQVDEMTEVVYRGKDKVKALKLAYQMIQRDPDLRMSDGHGYDLTRAQDREQTMRQIARLVQLKKSLNDPLLVQALFQAMGFYSASFTMKIYVHELLFRMAISLFGTAEQQDRWIQDLEDWRVIGCFAMTELGHSSNLRGLETTSTFDRATDEFVLHSPTLTSSKWWIGMAGETATHTVAICQTIIDGVNYGINWFIVPLRDPATGKLLPGVTCGDIGHKAARQGLDNGWIQFTQHRIPRENMLMKWAQLSSQGAFTPSPNPVLSYASLIPERFTLVRGCFVTLSSALTIAVRYGAVRRQGNHDEQILDYQTYYTALVPGVAFTYMLNTVDKLLFEKWDEVAEYAQTDAAQFMREIPDQHGVAAGFKGVLAWYTTEVLEACRRACGGHAYSSYNAIAGLIADFGVATTGGGDNVVLLQQTARYMMAAIKWAMDGQELVGSVSYLSDCAKILGNNNNLVPAKTTFQDPRDLLSFEFVIDTLTWVCAKKAAELSTILAREGKANADETWNANQTELVRLADVHSWRYFLIMCERGIERQRASNPEVYRMHKKMAQLVGTFVLKRHMDLLLEEGYFEGQHAKMVRDLFLQQCKDLRPDAVPLVDAWMIPDYILKAPIGKYDGDIYPAYFGTVNAAQLEGSYDAPGYWNKYVKPLVNP
ncbi:acyl-Coenzyme A oxidase [Podila clonocystis]|nr:acyl-Coenzyme A oxidase [Podila clonocystis]